MANDAGVAASSNQLFRQFHAVVNAQSILTDIAHVNIFDHTAIAGIKLVALRCVSVPGADFVNIVSSIVTMTPNTANPSPSAASQSRNVVKFIEKIVGIRNSEITCSFLFDEFTTFNNHA